MRNLPGGTLTHISKRIHTPANGSEIRLDCEVTRPTIPVTNDNFIEVKEVKPPGQTISDAGIAVSHPRKASKNERVYIAYVENGYLKVASAKEKLGIGSMIFTDESPYEMNGVGICDIAFDGTFEKRSDDKWEFITLGDPWVCWVDADGLKVHQLHSNDLPEVINENSAISDISMIRGFDGIGMDYGLCVFYIRDGGIYYSQRVDGQWSAEIEVTKHPGGVTFTKIKATRTWDYRICLQVRDNTGALYEIFTEYMGIGRHGAEHFSLLSITPSMTLTSIAFHDTKSKDEHFELSSVTPDVNLIWGLPTFAESVYNINDGEGDWGIQLKFELDHGGGSGFEENANQFVLTDSEGAEFYAQEADFDGDKTVTLTFINFNNAVGECTLSYTPGTIQSPATAMLAWEKTFTPTNLVPVELPVPEVVSIINI